MSINRIARRRFLKDSTIVLGSAAVAGSVVQTVYAFHNPIIQQEPTTPAKPVTTATAAPPPIMQAEVPEALVRIREKNHYVPVTAWISQNVVQLTGADTDSKRQALVNRLLHGHEKYLDVITKGGEHVGVLRFYVDVPHEVAASSLHEDTETHAMAAGDSKCVTNYICCTWKDGKTECCAKWQCCGIA